MPIPFIDLQAQRRRITRLIDEGMQRVLAHGQFIMGPEVTELERQLAELSGAPHVIACANEGLLDFVMQVGSTRSVVSRGSASTCFQLR